jgi:hypothetical protein
MREHEEEPREEEPMMTWHARHTEEGLAESAVGLVETAAGEGAAASSHADRKDTALALAAADGLLAEVEHALVEQDLLRAAHAWNRAYAAAVGSQRWEPMVSVGDAALRLDRAAGASAGYRAAARQVYLSALVRVRILRARDGLRRIADPFARMGDLEMARRVRRVTAHLS